MSGPYACCKEDIDKLKSDDIRAVLNLQTSYDMKYRSIPWEFLKNYYEQNQILVINFQIIDMDYEDIKNKGFEAAQILNKLVEKFSVILLIFIKKKLCLKFIESLCSLYSWNWQSPTYCNSLPMFVQGIQFRLCY